MHNIQVNYDQVLRVIIHYRYQKLTWASDFEVQLAEDQMENHLL